MTSFEERLWSDLVSRYGTLISQAPTTPLPAGAGHTPATSETGGRRRGSPGRAGLRVRTRSRALIAGAAVVAVAVAVAIAIGLTSGGGTAAYAVVSNPDGTVTVTIRDLVGVAGANGRLAALGVPIRAARTEAGCSVGPGGFQPTSIPPSGERPSTLRMVEGAPAVTVRLDAIPAGDTLLLIARQAGPGVVALSVRTYRGPAPSCVSPSEAPSLG